MVLLHEVITRASANSSLLPFESEYPITLNADSALLNLKSRDDDLDSASSLVNQAEGFQISTNDCLVIELGNKFFKDLKRNLKNPNSFGKHKFIKMFNSYLKETGEKLGILVDVDKSDNRYTHKLIKKLGFSIGRDVLGLVLEACISLDIWDVLECFIVNGYIGHSYSSDLVNNLIEKRRSNLICLCVKHLSDLQASDMLCIFKYFLLPPKDGYGSMESVRNEWESDALLAVIKANDKTVGAKELSLAKDAAVLLMIAHDGFTTSELCLHYLLASSNLDEVIFSSCISKLTGSEIMSFIGYLGKWLKKYERFPQACPCPKAPSSLGLRACKWVPSLDAILKCYGLVLDEHFSSFVLDSEFHVELASVKEVVNCLTAEASLSCTLVNLIEKLRTEHKGEFTD